ncbi:hypothetical protein [Acidianus sp. RZ1]|uniref:hypothetical protein n=1 Tax=Acidianus sp. RZ1 TaxID=1540082 RepID=UPI0020A489D9|nr:hypothetical protein [Acidianus sp. RZ1]
MERWKEIGSLSLEMASQVLGYSLQQYKEEIEHFSFFESYFPDSLKEVELPDSYISFFDKLMEDFRSGELQRVITRFHLVTEGILADLGLTILNDSSRRLGLKEFNDGIKRIIADEARHFKFGLSLISDKSYAVKRVEEIFPEAMRIVMDGKEELSYLGYEEEKLRDMMEKLRKARVNQLLT